MTFSDSYDGDKFFTVQGGVRMATPLLLVLLVIEVSDVVFAVDSIPAVSGGARMAFEIKPNSALTSEVRSLGREPLLSGADRV
jgi:predicted tellurium resistance membrane protein TerC